MDPQQQQAMNMVAGMMGFFIIFGLLMTAIIIIPLWKIATKAGLAGPISLLVLIPGVGLLVALYVLAFMQWKVVPAPPAYPNYPPPYTPPAPPTV